MIKNGIMKIRDNHVLQVVPLLRDAVDKVRSNGRCKPHDKEKITRKPSKVIGFPYDDPKCRVTRYAKTFTATDFLICRPSAKLLYSNGDFYQPLAK